MPYLRNSDQNKKISIYLPNLTGLRFVAALMVFVCHVESVKEIFNIPNLAENFFFINIGKLGVLVFFVLSGYLITYLLLREESSTAKVDIKKFYLRRILRIWPLYFLIVIFGLYAAPYSSFFHLPNFLSALSGNNTTQISLLFFFFLPNYVYAAFGGVPYAVQTWSVGTEEQFYLVWPWLIKKIKNKTLLFPAVFIVYNIIKIVLIALQHRAPAIKALLDFWYYFNIDCMALGAVAAYFVITKNEKILKIIFSIAAQLITYITIIILIGFAVIFRYFHFEIYGFFFTIAIANLAANKKSILNLENKIFNYMGKISYGIYMYHLIALTIALRILIRLNFLNNVAIYLLGFIITIILSSLSYFYFESYFLKLKNRFSIFSNKKQPVV
ncbi:MAG: acyltransferase [Ferruginibacter sp.]